MIVKHCPIKNIAKSNIVHLVDYLVSQKTNDRVDTIRIVNGESVEITDTGKDALKAAVAMQAIQDKNTRATNDKTYHFFFSFRPAEEPDEKTIREIEDAYCNALASPTAVFLSPLTRFYSHYS